MENEVVYLGDNGDGTVSVSIGGGPPTRIMVEHWQQAQADSSIRTVEPTPYAPAPLSAPPAEATPTGSFAEWPSDQAFSPPPSEPAPTSTAPASGAMPFAEVDMSALERPESSSERELAVETSGLAAVRASREAASQEQERRERLGMQSLPGERDPRDVAEPTGPAGRHPLEPTMDPDAIRQRALETLLSGGGGRPLPRSMQRDLAAAALGDAGAQSRLRAALENTFRTQSRGLDTVGGTMDQAISDDTSLLETIAAGEAERQAEIRELFDETNRQVADLANMRVNPDRELGGMYSPNRITAAVAVALGAAAQAFGPVQNAGLAVIQQAISDDIQAQMADISSKHNAIRARQSAVGQFRALLQDDRAAETAARLSGLQVAEQTVRRQLVGAQSDDVIARGQAMLAQLDAQKAALQLQLLQQMARRATRGPGRGRVREVVAQLNRMADAQEHRRDQLVAERAADRDRAGRDMPDEFIPPMGVSVLPGLEDRASRYWGQLNETSHDKLLSLVGGYGGMMQSLEDLRQLRQEVGNGETLNRRQVGRARAISSQLRGSFAVLLDQGAIGQQEEQRFANIVPDVSDHEFLNAMGTNDLTLGSLEGTMDALRTGVESKLRAAYLRLEDDDTLRERLGIRSRE